MIFQEKNDVSEWDLEPDTSEIFVHTNFTIKYAEELTLAHMLQKYVHLKDIQQRDIKIKCKTLR